MKHSKLFKRVCPHLGGMDLSSIQEVQELYHDLIDAWNRRDAQRMAELFGEEGVQVGFDGSMAIGREEILSHLAPIFEKYPTAPYVVKIKDIRFLGSDVAFLRAVAGMVPSGKSDIKSNVNAHQTVVAVKKAGSWCIELFQNTPAQYHGRPELVEALTEELRKLL